MTVFSTPEHPLIAGLHDAARPVYDQLIAQIRSATDAVSGARLSVGGYRAAARYLDALTLDRVENVFEPYDRRQHDKVVAGYRRLRRKVRSVSQARLCELAEGVLRTQWKGRHGDAEASGETVAFTLSNFNSYSLMDATAEVGLLLDHWLLAGCGEHRLVAAPRWVHDLFTFWWSSVPGWRAVAEDVPDGIPILGPGPAAALRVADEEDFLRGLWSPDPLEEFFDPRRVLETARLV